MTTRTLHNKEHSVGIKRYQPVGTNKLNRLPFSKEVYTVGDVRKPTASYVLELRRENKQPLRILAHHRNTKKIFERPPHLRDLTEATSQQFENNISSNNPSSPERHLPGRNTTGNPPDPPQSPDRLPSRHNVTSSGRKTRPPAHLRDFER